MADDRLQASVLPKRAEAAHRTAAPQTNATDDDCGCGHEHHAHHHGHHHHTAVETYTRGAAKVGRNDACPCGSGKKHKKCCLTA